MKRIVLEQLSLPQPCPVSWSSMQGDHRQRHCTQCNQPVYNLSALSRAEAETLLAAQPGCVSVCRRADGTVATRDFRARPVPSTVRGIAARVLAPTLFALSLAACGDGGLTGDGRTGGAPVMQPMSPANSMPALPANTAPATAPQKP